MGHISRGLWSQDEFGAGGSCIYQSFLEDILCSNLLMCNCSWKIMEDWGNMLGNLLAKFTCSTSLVICFVWVHFTIVHDLSKPLCVHKSGAQVVWGQKHAIVQYWSGLINTPPWIWMSAKILWQICRNLVVQGIGERDVANAPNLGISLTLVGLGKWWIMCLWLMLKFALNFRLEPKG
jgi:hypothetical protein